MQLLKPYLDIWHVELTDYVHVTVFDQCMYTYYRVTEENNVIMNNFSL